MDRLAVLLSVVLLITSFLTEVTNAETHNDERSLEAYSKRKSTALWFGPRLGRRKRNPNGDEYRSPALEREQLDALIDVIPPEIPVAILAFNGKRHTVNFVPRLGRESGEDMGNAGPSSDRWLQDPDFAGDLMSQRSPPFAPRLGRRLVPISPRLGRENDRA